jgi:hypothetical protein
MSAPMRTFGRRTAGRFLVTGLLVTALGIVASPHRTVAAGMCGAAGVVPGGSTSECDYSTSGEDYFLVPAGVDTLIVTAYGAQGYRGGEGAMVQATISVPTGPSTVYVDVGGNGKSPSSGPNGGTNGGGSGYGGGGGGASDVRTCSSVTGADGHGNACDTLTSRLLVAGGGGNPGLAAVSTGGPGNASLPGAVAAADNNGSTGTSDVSGDSGGGGGIAGASGGAGGTGGGVGLGCAAGGAHGSNGTSGSAGVGGNGGVTGLVGGVDTGGGGGGYVGGGGGGGGAGSASCGSFEAVASGGGGGGGSSYVAPSATAVTSSDTTHAPEIDVVAGGSTLALVAGLRVSVAHGWTTMTWHATSHVLGFDVYSGTWRLNRTPVRSASTHYIFAVHAVVQHPRLRAIPRG